MLARVVLYSLIVLVCASASARDYLEKGWWGKPLDFEMRYQKAVERILAPAFERNVVLRTMHLPPFESESTVGVARSPAGYRLFWAEPTFQIWQAITDRKEELPKIRRRYKDKEIGEALAKRIVALSQQVLHDPRNYGTEKGAIYLDTSHFIFFVGFDPGERLTANTLHFDRGTKAWELIEVSDAMYKYVLGKGSQTALERRVARAERKIRLTANTKASNKTMQPTAGRRTASL